jgi:hypothetical protein
VEESFVERKREEAGAAAAAAVEMIVLDEHRFDSVPTRFGYVAVDKDCVARGAVGVLAHSVSLEAAAAAEEERPTLDLPEAPPPSLLLVVLRSNA